MNSRRLARTISQSDDTSANHASRKSTYASSRPIPTLSTEANHDGNRLRRAHCRGVRWTSGRVGSTGSARGSGSSVVGMPGTSTVIARPAAAGG